MFAQFGYNELQVARIRFISKELEAQNQPPVPQSATDESPWGYRMLSLIGVHRVSNEEYMARMIKTRDGYLEQIRELEEQIEKDSKSQ